MIHSDRVQYQIVQARYGSVKIQKTKSYVLLPKKQNTLNSPLARNRLLASVRKRNQMHIYMFALRLSTCHVITESLVMHKQN